MRHITAIITLGVLLTASMGTIHADTIPLPGLPAEVPAVEAEQPARSLPNLDLYTTTATAFESGMLGIGASWTGSTAFPVVEKQPFFNEMSAFVRAGWRHSKTIFVQFSAPVWLEIAGNGDVDVSGTISARGHVGTSTSTEGAFGVDLEEEVSLWRRTDRQHRGEILLPRAEYGAYRGQGLRTETTLWLRRHVDSVATFALPLSYAYDRADVSSSGLADTREAHEITVGGGIRDYSSSVHRGWLEAIGLTWSTIRISGVQASGSTSQPPGDTVEPPPADIPDIKLRPGGTGAEVQLQRIDLRVANLDDYVWEDNQNGAGLVVSSGAWLGGSWLIDEAGDTESIFAYHYAGRLRGGNEDFTMDFGIAHDRLLRHDVVGRSYFIEYLVEGVLGGHSERYGFGVESKVAARWLIDVETGEDLPAAVVVASDAWLTVWGPLDLGFYHRADQMPVADQQETMPWRHEAGLFVRAAHAWQ